MCRQPIILPEEHRDLHGLPEDSSVYSTDSIFILRQRREWSRFVEEGDIIINPNEPLLGFFYLQYDRMRLMEGFNV